MGAELTPQAAWSLGSVQRHSINAIVSDSDSARLE